MCGWVVEYQQPPRQKHLSNTGGTIVLPGGFKVLPGGTTVQWIWVSSGNILLILLEHN